MAHDETKAKLDRLLAEPFDSSAECEFLCNELQDATALLDEATGTLRSRLLARIRAINGQRKALGCGECYFQ